MNELKEKDIRDQIAELEGTIMNLIDQADDMGGEEAERIQVHIGHLGYRVKALYMGLEEGSIGKEEADPKPKPVWTGDKVAALIDRMPGKELHRPLRKIWNRQTVSEKHCWGAHSINGRGFNKNDAPFAGSLLVQWDAKGFLSGKQDAALRKMLKKYRNQLAEIANVGE